MSETVLLDLEPVLLERVRRFAATKGWSQPAALVHLIEHGLFACEPDAPAGFDDTDAHILQEAIAALEKVEDDPGFSLIGRIATADD
ncbi:hypothetical protein INQ41_00845 [Lysobacter ciconiae]|uniref:Uncharacterized protein n=1 Tax=Novilysobacter ciconiae TaxID=2781022 RepID=A0A7S6UGA4_9GAMM|nr:hypothetical protein [Lysobacter ciconiae]QOW19674.1 hypothetical protein INQ41_00845 [Lysobacter ciconiae]